VGAAVAQFVGFAYTFALVGIMALTGCFVLFGLEQKEYVSKINIRHYHRRRKMFHFVHHGRHH
jgi:predicted MFS family arabinose efflux permease